jgi:protease IV
VLRHIKAAASNLTERMKAFFGSFFGTLFAIFFLIALGVVGCIAVIALVGTSAKAPAVPSNSLLVLDLAVPIMDAPEEFDPSQLLAGLSEDRQETQVTLRDVLRAISLAATDNKIKGIFITGNLLPISNYASRYPALKEVREALQKFKASGKPIYAYLQFCFAPAYYVESVADKLFVDPQAEFILRGPSTFPLYYAGALKKFGIGVQVFRVGKYKSYVEPFIRENMSPENRQQLEQLFGDIWSDVTAKIEEARGLPPGSFEQLINQNGLIDGDLAVKSKLGTELISLSEIMDRLSRQYGDDKQHNTFRQVTVSSYLGSMGRNPSAKVDTGAKIAVVYAEGEIVDGEGGPENVGGERYVRAIRKFRLDPNVKAIVLRVNSPGGSGFASEEIYRELRSAQAVKPVVVSMGGYAASGGYYISLASNRVFAEPTTITGSIGVFGLVVNFEKIANENGITTDSVTTTTPLATLFDPIKEKSAADLAILQKSVDKFYDQFLQRVSEGRHIPVPQVNEIAQGRVWSGSEAVKLKLADEAGGFSSAVAYAAKLAHLGDHSSIIEFPERRDLSEKLKELFKSPRPPVAKLDPVDQCVKELANEFRDLRTLNDPEGIYARFPADIR